MHTCVCSWIILFILTIFLIHLFFRNPNHEEKVLKLPVPSPTSDEFKAAPKLCYPLVIFLFTDSEETPKPEETVSFTKISIYGE